MNKIDKAILDTSQVICDNIRSIPQSNRGLLSQNILSHVQSFVEYVAVKIYLDGRDEDSYIPEIHNKAIEEIRKDAKYYYLYKLYDLVQESVPYNALDKDYSERLMLKYREYLLRIREFLSDSFGLNTLENLTDFPSNTDKGFTEYYEKIVEKINNPSLSCSVVMDNGPFYVRRIKTFFIDQQIYYEVSFIHVNSRENKSNQFIAFTNIDIMENYAVKFMLHTDSIHILDKDMPILVIDDYEVSILECEWSKLSEILGDQTDFDSESLEYTNLMDYIKRFHFSLTYLVSSKKNFYEQIQFQVTGDLQTTEIFDLLDKCREIIVNSLPGHNVLCYLLYKMNFRVMRDQYPRSKSQCDLLSNLYLKYDCVQFEKMPFCTSLSNHNPRIYDLLQSIPHKNTEFECELLARRLNNNTIINGHLFTSKSYLNCYSNYLSLIAQYNNRLEELNQNRAICNVQHYYYISENVDVCIDIISRLIELSTFGVPDFTEKAESWLENYNFDQNYQDQLHTLKFMFAESHVALIYGSAGTGKTTLLKHISNFWADKEKIFLSVTNPAVDNMKRTVGEDQGSFKTIASIKKNEHKSCDILFLDECSNISNRDMVKVFEHVDFSLLVLIGDICQIEPVRFGNWFSIAPFFVPESAVFSLNQPCRIGEDDSLFTLWESVRHLDDSILESLIRNQCTAPLDESFFEESFDEDEIILCLNYDGLFGINNLNRFFQSLNSNYGVSWGLYTFKVGDPILFDNSKTLAPLLYNNMRGIIRSIKTDDEKIEFEIELDKSLSESDLDKENGKIGYGLTLSPNSNDGHTIISFSVSKCKYIDDNGVDISIVPFQLAYAVSIHKAQGLEYNSVKIVITNESEEYITRNIFYTAITRARKNLKIYWSPVTENNVLNGFRMKDVYNDAMILSDLSPLLKEHIHFARIN